MIPSTVTDEVTALSTDQVDSIWIYWAWAGEKCKRAGLDTNYFAFADIDPVFDFYTPVIIANNDVIESDAEMVQAFRDATRRGYEDCIADPQGAAEVLLKAAPELEKELGVASQTYLAEQYQADAESWGEIDPKTRSTPSGSTGLGRARSASWQGWTPTTSPSPTSTQSSTSTPRSSSPTTM